MRLKTLATHPVWREPRTVFGVWMLTGVIFAIVKLLIGKYNNYKIFEGVYWHAIEGLTLYGDHYPEYYDSNHYGVLFSLIIAPFALLPEWLGMILWIAGNTALLFYAISRLPLSSTPKIIIYWYSYCELMTAQGVQQFNISVGLVCFVIPVLYTPGFEYVISQYIDWFERLKVKNMLNMFADPQNISLLGVVRKISGNAEYSDMWLIIPGLILFCIPYLRISQYKYLAFRFMLLANVLLFVVLFSTGSEASGYIIAMIGAAIWYICSVSPHKKYTYWLWIATLVIVGLSTTELVPSIVRNGLIRPYVIKAWPCIVVWLTICYEMCFLDFSHSPYKHITT